MAAVTAVPSNYWYTGGGQGYSLLSNEKASLSFRLKRELKKRGLLSERGTLPVLTGNAVGAGGAVNVGYNRIQYGNTSATMPGGVQPTEYVAAHTGATTSLDEQTVDSFAVLNTQPAYVRNGDNNPRFNNGG